MALAITYPEKNAAAYPLDGDGFIATVRADASLPVRGWLIHEGEVYEAQASEWIGEEWRLVFERVKPGNGYKLFVAAGTPSLSDVRQGLTLAPEKRLRKSR